ncbi:MAG: hypothetical protein KF810_23290 [Rhizobiaceae bacterium]|nr:hypothetical protein [Rhizobiaceae bacterium]
MRKTIFAVAALMALAGCTTAENDAAVGGTAGAIIGGLATGDAGGAIVGGVVGAASGVLLGKATRTGWCRYRDRYGRIYEARCR